MEIKKIKKGEKIVMPSSVINPKDDHGGWSTTKSKESGLLVATSPGEKGVFLSEEKMMENGYVPESLFDDFFDFYKGKRITKQMIADFFLD
jgi:hypothetical protein